MTTLTFKIKVDDQVGADLRRDKQKRKKLNFLITNLLKTASKPNPKERLLLSMDKLSDQAEINGLTEETLASLLAEIDEERD
ncbi:hypothetical protein FHS57_003641 [Runella defluvii]|uniref:Uncharacterized protein n=1 Tax=Runella defluvii TaxID=370973 RepID=A0A7W5ZLK2_9BACT|nr:hypothetical protein [Runella defluvii]MBB3839632.1 hypothetical protein [Runella defluvii]